jgi:xanthine dehydrogenase accessory factor
MASQLFHLLEKWQENKDNYEWVLGVVYKTEGSSYRKTGAMMLFNSLGQQFGMLSGGCIEGDILIHAKACMSSNKPSLLTYDGSDEDDLSFQLGIGCGGKVHILLQAINQQNDYLSLLAVYQALAKRKSGTYFQEISASSTQAYFTEQTDATQTKPSVKPVLIEKNNQQWLSTPIKPVPHLLVIGGGVDARPVVDIASTLGWTVSLWDPRAANARKNYFTAADTILKGSVESVGEFARNKLVDAVILMSHSVSLDAACLSVLQQETISYMALLGPTHRKNQVLDVAKLKEEALTVTLSGPAGLDLGDEYPESIALSIISECQASLNKKTATSISGVLNKFMSC